MTLGSGEKAALAGGALLALGLVTFLLLEFWPSRVEEEAPPGGGSAGTREDPPESAAGEEPSGSPGRSSPRADATSDLQKEIHRLRDELARREDEIRRLRSLLEEAGRGRREGAEDSERLAEEAVAALKACNPRTPVRDIAAIRLRLVQQGPEAIRAVARCLASGEDVTFSEIWIYDEKTRRFSSFPTLRTTLIDVVYHIGAEGQEELVSLMAQAASPLEICQIVGFLSDVKSVPRVTQARLEAARRYVSLDPPPRESYVVGSVLDALLAQEPDRAAASLGELVRREGRQVEVVRMALRRTLELPPEVAVPLLAGIASDGDMGERAAVAAEQLAATPGEAAVGALDELLPGADSGLRRAAYRSLGEPVRAMLAEVEGAGRERGFGIQERAELERAEKDLAARRALVTRRLADEAEVSTRPSLEAARDALDELERRVEELKKRLAKD